MKFWKPFNRNSSTFFKVNGNLPVDPSDPQVMRCIVCHSSSVGPEILAMRTRCRKGLITYNKANGIAPMKKHVEVENSVLSKKYGEEVSSRFKDPLERQPAKKRQGCGSLQEGRCGSTNLLGIKSFSVCPKHLAAADGHAALSKGHVSFSQFIC